jgi:hypothetical protein
MPYVIRPPVRRMSLIGAIFSVLLCMLLAPALSKADTTSTSTAQCPDVSLANTFSTFGDLANYTPVADGHFENGLGGWSVFGGGYIAGGNEPWYIRSLTDSSNLTIKDGGPAADGGAVSPAFCVDTGYPYFRFFARNPGRGEGTLQVNARWTVGQTQYEEALGTLYGGSYKSWAVSTLLPLADRIDLQNGTQNVQLVFKATKGTWQIDDVYIDPYRR